MPPKGRDSSPQLPPCFSSQAWGARTGFKQDSTCLKMNLQGRTAGRQSLFISPSPLTFQSFLQLLTFCLKHTHPFHLSNLPCLSKGQAAQSPIVMLLHVSNKYHCKFYLLMSTVIKLKRHGTNHQKTWVWTLLLLSRFSHVQPCEIPQTVAHQTPPSLGFSRQEHWSGLPFPSPVHESEKWKWSRSVMSDS